MFVKLRGNVAGFNVYFGAGLKTRFCPYEDCRVKNKFIIPGRKSKID